MKYKLSLSLAFSFAALLSVAEGAVQAWPAPFEAEYEGHKFPFTAKATIRLARLGDYYRYTVHGVVRVAFYKTNETYDCSVLQVRGGELLPLEYVHRDRRDERRNLHTRFDWSHKTVRSARGDGTVLEVNGLREPVWDPMSFHVRLRADVPALAPGREHEYAVIERRGVVTHRARHDGTETLGVDGTALQAAKVTVESPRRTSVFWFAPDYAWLPVRLSVRGVALDLVTAPRSAARPVEPAPATTLSCE